MENHVRHVQYIQQKTINTICRQLHYLVNDETNGANQDLYKSHLVIDVTTNCHYVTNYYLKLTYPIYN